MNLDYLGRADSRIRYTYSSTRVVFFTCICTPVAVARRRDRGRLVIFSAASCHEKDTGRFIGRDLLTPSLEREREMETETETQSIVREKERGGIFSFRFLHTRICWCLASSILNRM